MKYKTLAELKAVIDAGLVSSDCVITIDNDSTSMYGDELDEDGYNVEIFDGGMPSELLEQALDFLGIPHEPAQRGMIATAKGLACEADGRKVKR